ncbi:CapA family protein [Galactobacillus timonensis]|uniref:CapA family protein n=1 Tax=Galactobacillus timonensis TaxID=2041840 RepID=UPI000C819A17|nr:CapA family protein [Galactobacillus timonensis]
MAVKIVIGADLVPTDSNHYLFKNGNVSELIGDKIYRKIKSADFSIFNLEVPLVDNGNPILKFGPNLIASTDNIKGLKEINPFFFNLANNHILDQGAEGLKSTVDVLDKANIAHAGAGRNVAEAALPYITEINGLRIGIYCCAEHEFTTANENASGANPFDPLNSLDHIYDLKNKTDYVIVLYHGGKENYRYPSPHLQKVCRKLIDKGANLVVCQHSHCIGSMENWNNGTIVYGQGNFLFDGSDDDSWMTSLLIDLDITRENGNIISSINFIPLCKQKEKVRLADGDEAFKILNGFRERSQEIKNPECVNRHYQELADSSINNYLSTVSGKKSLLFRIIDKLSGHKFNRLVISKRFDKNALTGVRNYIECEAHHELLLQGINDKLFSNKQG